MCDNCLSKFCVISQEVLQEKEKLLEIPDSELLIMCFYNICHSNFCKEDNIVTHISKVGQKRALAFIFQGAA
jgi:hypothetical protein